MLNPFIDLIADLLQLYLFCVFAWAVLATLISFKIVDKSHPLVRKVWYALNRLVEPALKPIQKLLPDLGGIDISPIILILLIHFAERVLYTYLYNL